MTTAGQFRAGWTVRIRELQTRPDLNGTKAYVLGSERGRFAMERGRVAISTCPGVELMCVLPERLEVIDRRVAGFVTMEEYRKAQNPHAPPEPTDEERFSLCVPPLESVRRQCIEAWPGLPPYRATQEAIALRTWLRGLSVQEWKAYKFLPHPAMTPRRMREALPETPPLE